VIDPGVVLRLPSTVRAILELGLTEIVVDHGMGTLLSEFVPPGCIRIGKRQDSR